jgi:DNA polymerase-3 subunit gamma/tau
MLGSVDQQYVSRILDALVNKNAEEVLHTVAELDKKAPDYDAILAELLTWLQRIALLQMAPQRPFEDDLLSDESIRQLAIQLDPEDVQLFYQIALIGRRDLPLAPDARGGFEMILLRMLCFLPAISDPSEADGNPVAPLPASPVVSSRKSVASESPAQSSAFSPVISKPVNKPKTDLNPARTDVSSEIPASADSMTVQPGRSLAIIDWNQLVEELGLTALAKQLAVHCVVKDFSGNILELLLDPRHSQVRTGNSEERLRMALEKYFGVSLQLQIKLGEQTTFTPAQKQAQHQIQRHQEAVELIEQDPNVKAMQETFNARITPDSIVATD